MNEPLKAKVDAAVQAEIDLGTGAFDLCVERVDFSAEGLVESYKTLDTEIGQMENHAAELRMGYGWLRAAPGMPP